MDRMGRSPCVEERELGLQRAQGSSRSQDSGLKGRELQGDLQESAESLIRVLSLMSLSAYMRQKCPRLGQESSTEEKGEQSPEFTQYQYSHQLE